VGQQLLYDKRDNRLDPTAGYFAALSTDLAGFGGDVRYVRNKVTGAYYYSIVQDWVLSVSAEYGNIIGIGQQVKIQDRFFIGGDDLRGFATAGIGPRDSITHDALGGNQYYVGSLSLGFPLGLPQELGVSGRVFTDVCDLWGIDENQAVASGATILDVNKLRASGGIGATWKSPFGPIRLDLARPILRQDFDKSELFRVSFGTRF
jgi:outer membrane protein insertion porin family